MATGDVILVTRLGKSWYKKRNRDSRLTDLELRIYNALHSDRTIQFMGIEIPEIQMEDGALLVRNAGTTFAAVLNSSAYRSLADEKVLYRIIQVRAAVNTVVNRTLTDEDKVYLAATQRTALVQSAQKINPTVTEQDVARHYWAYRMMNALGIFDEQFKDNYTEVIGKRIDALLSKYGSWCTDNYVRNNVVCSDGSIIPFDFNSIRFGLRQFDDATIAGLYVFAGPLAVNASPEKRLETMRKLQEVHGLLADDDYLPAFLLSCIHANGIIAGYRTRDIKKAGPGDNPLDFAYSFEEIETYQTTAVMPIREFGHALVKTDDELEKLSHIASVITHYTFGQRLLTLMGRTAPPRAREYVLA